MQLKNPFTQIEQTERVLEFANDIGGKGIELAKNILRKIHSQIKKVDADPKIENPIRWRRTATEILNDGWVAIGKSCTDLTVLFIAIAKAKGLEARFVKAYSTKKRMLHSLVELNIDNKKIYFDATNGKFDDGLKELLFEEYKIYKIGQDSWDIGLCSIEDGNNLVRELYDKASK